MKFVKILLIIILILDFTFVNISLIILWSRSHQSLPDTLPSPTIPPSPTTFPSPQVNTTPTVTVIVESPSAISKTSKIVSYITVPGSGNTDKNSWTDLPGTEFYLNTSDYPGLTDARLEANFRLLNGNGYAFLRLFDTTVGIEVWGSEVKTNSQSFTVVASDKLTLRPGNHLYRIQAKSLTADTTIYNSGRIKLTSAY